MKDRPHYVYVAPCFDMEVVRTGGVVDRYPQETSDENAEYFYVAEEHGATIYHTRHATRAEAEAKAKELAKKLGVPFEPDPYAEEGG